MSDLRSLYQETILEHGRHPRNFGHLEGATHQAQGHNTVCGDRIRVELELDGDRIEDVRFEGAGCAISTASASIMTERIKGRTLDEAREVFQGLRELLTGEGAPDPDALGKLAIFEGVRAFPMRVKCATLAWHTLLAALEGRDEVSTTE